MVTHSNITVPDYCDRQTNVYQYCLRFDFFLFFFGRQVSPEVAVTVPDIEIPEKEQMDDVMLFDEKTGSFRAESGQTWFNRGLLITQTVLKFIR